MLCSESPYQFIFKICHKNYLTLIIYYHFQMTEDTVELFLEVTSSNSVNACRQAMQALIKEILMLGIADIDISDEHFHNMVIHQVKVVDPEGNLRNVYPSRTDLIFEDDNTIVVERE